MGETVAQKKAIILGGSEIRNYAAIKSLIGPDDVIICADSGYYHCQPLGVKPDLLVGDFDSLQAVPANVSKVALPADKNYTDTTFSIEGALHQGATQIVLAGMLHGRLDHTLANIQSLVYCTNQNINAFITDGETQIFCLVADKGAPKSVTLEAIKDYYFSLISFSEKCLGVTINGGRFPLNNHTLTFDLARGISNEFVKKQSVNIQLKEGTLLIMLVPKEPKGMPLWAKKLGH